MSAPQAPPADDIQTLFRYTRWANARMLDAMQAAEAAPSGPGPASPAGSRC